MAISLKARKELATNSQFLLKVEMAMCKLASDVAGEAVSSPAKATLDQKRHDLTVSVIADKGTWLARFAHVAASLGTLTTASTDADVEFTVSAIWNDMAGVSAADLTA